LKLSAALTGWIQDQWYGRPEPPILLRPVAGLFSGAVFLRRKAYALGLKRAERLPVPVVVVGNLSVGGTGKTPLTIAVAEILARAGFRPGIVSRGYGGRPQPAPVTVGADSDPGEVGDEPVLMARRSACPVAVYPVRAAAARHLLDTARCDIIVADDGLQHYALARDLEIAVIDGARRFGNGACLPAGPLREPPSRLASVDLVVCQGGVPHPGEFPMRLEGGEAVKLLDPDERKPLTAFAGTACRALAGIGNPERFFAHLRAAGLEVMGRSFPDHHRFVPGDLEGPVGVPLLMTEKDAVKCRAFAGPDHWYVPVTAHLPDGFEQQLLNRLKAKRDG